jgi:hypothetical protein
MKPISDAARRIADSMNLHAVAKSKGYAVFSLQDGRSPDNNTPYENLGDAYRIMKWDRDNYIYLEIQSGGVVDEIIQAYLDYARMLRDNGGRMPDPRDFNAPDKDFPYHTPPLLQADWQKQISELVKRK